MMRFLKRVKDFLVFIRWFHSMLALFPFVTLFFLLRNDSGFQSCDITTLDFVIVCAGVQTILISGVILNDLVDVGIDRINKLERRSIGRTTSYRWAIFHFVLFSLISLGVSIYIVRHIFWDWIWLGTGAYLISLAYNLVLKRLPLVGNIVMATLAAFVPLVIPVLIGDCIHSIENDRIEVLIYVYALLVFLTTVPRELSLDISDRKGDHAHGYRTLPIMIGERKSKQVVSLFILVTIALSIWAMSYYSHLIVPFVVMDLGFLYFLYRLPNTFIRSGYVKICRQLWLSMIIGMIGSTIMTVL